MTSNINIARHRYDDDDARGIIRSILQERVENDELSDYPLAKMQEHISLITRRKSAFGKIESIENDVGNGTGDNASGNSSTVSEENLDLDSLEQPADPGFDVRKIEAMARRIYPEYEMALRQRNAFDFDGLIVHVLLLLQISSVNNSETARQLTWEHFGRNDIAGINAGLYDDYLYGQLSPSLSLYSSEQSEQSSPDAGPLDNMVAQVSRLSQHVSRIISGEHIYIATLKYLHSSISFMNVHIPSCGHSVTM